MIFNFFLTLTFKVKKISERHQLLRETISTRQDENDSYEMVTHLNNCLTPIFLTALCLEILLFYIYTNMVILFHFDCKDTRFFIWIRCILGRKLSGAKQKN